MTDLATYTDGMTACQRAAFAGAIRDRMHVISGPAGTGKTFVIARLVRYFEDRGLRVVLTAPTGKAAKRLEQVTGKRAQTIHRLLGFDGKVFLRGPDDPIPADVVISDETSMVDVPLAYHLFRAIDLASTRVILTGDAAQLPPVGPGNILRDVIRERLVPTTILDEVVRQAGALRHNSLEILNGRMVGMRASDAATPDWRVIPRFDDPDDLLNYLLHLYQSVLAEKLGYDLLRDVQVLVPQRKGVVGVENLNIALQAVAQKKVFGRDIEPVRANRRPRLYPGDKVIQVRNDYTLDVMNGHVGYVVDADERVGRWIVDFEDRGQVEVDDKHIANVVLAYACTVHKYQGSEVPCAISIFHSSQSFMLHRNLAYTAVTRARKQAVILGDSTGIQRAVRVHRADDRITLLSVLEAA